MHIHKYEFNSPLYYYLFLSLQLIIILALYLKLAPLIIFISAIIFIAFALINVKWALYTLLFIMLILPPHGYSYAPLGFSFSLKLLYIMISVIIFFFIIEVTTERKNIVSIPMSLPVIFFLIYVVFAALIGFLYGNSPEFVGRDFVVLAIYGFFLFIPSILRSKQDFYNVLKIFIFGTIVITLEYYIIFIYHLLAGTFVRINAIQGQVFLFSIPFIIGAAATIQLPRVQKVLLIALASLSLGSIAISLARTLGFSLILGVIITIIIFHKNINMKYLFFSIVFFVICFVLLFVFLSEILHFDIWTFIVARAATLLELSEVTSFQQRLAANKIILDEILKNPIFGYGLGREVSYSFMGTSYALRWIDNSYYMLLWKLGLIGTIPFLWLTIWSLKKSISIFKNAKNRILKVFSGSMIAFIVTWLISGITTPSLIKYMTNICWVTLLALVIMADRIYTTHTSQNAYATTPKL